jgi:hypothetical protein
MWTEAAMGMTRVRVVWGMLFLALSSVASAYTSYGAAQHPGGLWEDISPPPSLIRRGRGRSLLSCAAPNDELVFVTGAPGLLLYRERIWTALRSAAPRSLMTVVEGVSEQHLFAAGSHEVIQRWDGHRWLLEHAPPSAPFSQQFAALQVDPGARSVRALGGRCPRVRDATGSWTCESQPEQPPLPPPGCAGPVFFAANGDYWARCAAAPHVFRDGQWAALTLPPSLRAAVRRGVLYHLARADGWYMILHARRGLFRWSAGGWEGEDVPTAVNGVCASSSRVFAVGVDGRVFRRLR